MDEQMREKIRGDAGRLIEDFYDSPDRGSWPDWAFAAVLTMDELLAVIAALSQPAAQVDSSHSAGGECGGVQGPLRVLERYEDARIYCLRQANFHPDSKEVCHQTLARTRATGREIYFAALLDDMALALKQIAAKKATP